MAVDINDICINAVGMYKKHPKTFEIPSIREIENAEYVKICVKNERFWVKVDGINSKEQTVKGTVANNLIIVDLNFGDKVTFNYDKVYSVQE